MKIFSSSLKTSPLGLFIFILTLGLAMPCKIFAQDTLAYPKIATIQDVESNTLAISKPYRGEDVLVLFDIDYTLLLPKNPAFQVANRIRYREKLKPLFQNLNPDEATMLINLMANYPSELVDAKAPSFIEKLQKQNIKVIACTGSMTGQLLGDERCEVLRFEALKKQGIDLSRAFPAYPELELSNLQGFLKRSPVFYKGILFANGLKDKACKGEALVEFLKRVSFAPKLIIFVDDKTHYLADVEASLKAQMPQVVFKGIEFTGETMHTPEILTEAEFLSTWQDLKEKASVLVKACTEKS